MNDLKNEKAGMATQAEATSGEGSGAETGPVKLVRLDNGLCVEALLDETQTAEFLGVSKSNLRSWRFKRIGPPYCKMVGVVRYALEDLRRYMDICRISVDMIPPQLKRAKK